MLILFNQEKALVGACSVIVKTNCCRWIICTTTNIYCRMDKKAHRIFSGSGAGGTVCDECIGGLFYHQST